MLWVRCPGRPRGGGASRGFRAAGRWVPARWNWTDTKSLDLLAGTPVNCLLLKAVDAAFAQKAQERGIVVLALIAPGGDTAESARQPSARNYQGVVLEGDFPKGTAARVKDVLADSKAIVIQLTARSQIDLAGPDPIVGTYQGVWPGIEVLESGAAKAGPSGIGVDRHQYRLHPRRAGLGTRGHLDRQSPAERTIVTGERYLQALADAAMAGGRWVMALDDDFSKRLREGEMAAVRDWKRIGRQLAFFEAHPEWRGMQPYGKLAIVQDASEGGLLSGGILT